MMEEKDIIEDLQCLRMIDSERDFAELWDSVRNDEEFLEGFYIFGISIDEKDFSGLECEKMYFENCSFSRCDLKKTYFKNSIFKNCDLSNCNFSESTFSVCIFKNVKAVGANFSECGVKTTDLQDCVFRYAAFTNSVTDSVSICESDMGEVFFDECKLKKTRFEKTNLFRANFYKTMLKGIDFRGNTIEGIVISNEAWELKGAVVDLMQAAELAKLLGVVIK